LINIADVADLSEAAQRHGITIECFVEIDCGAGRCGVTTTPEVVEIAKAIDAAPGLKFTGLQAYQGAMQHMDSYEDRKTKLDAAIAQVKDVVEALEREKPALVSGGGTGSYYSRATQVSTMSSSAAPMLSWMPIMAASSRRTASASTEANGRTRSSSLTRVMSHVKPDKAQSVDSGLHFIYGRDDIEYIKCSDEHGVISDPKGALKINEKLKLVTSHCDPTCNVHDWYVGGGTARSRRYGRCRRGARPTEALFDLFAGMIREAAP
jgi:3-hydroxy-D-aspartate aldolase